VSFTKHFLTVTGLIVAVSALRANDNRNLEENHGKKVANLLH